MNLLVDWHLQIWRGVEVVLVVERVNGTLIVHSDGILVEVFSRPRQELRSELLAGIEVAFAAGDSREGQSHSLFIAQRQVDSLDLLENSPRLFQRPSLLRILHHRSLQVQKILPLDPEISQTTDEDFMSPDELYLHQNFVHVPATILT